MTDSDTSRPQMTDTVKTTTVDLPLHHEIIGPAGSGNDKPRHHQPSRFSFDLSEYHPDADNAELGLPFFSTRSRRRGDTWIVSLFLFVHVVAFAATMAVNDCPEKSHGDCAVKMLGRFSFQLLSENPLLGPSASTMDSMGALRRSSLTTNHQIWRVFTCPWLHAGVIHLLVNLVSIGLVGIHLEEEFGPLRVGMIYILSALFGSVVGALFVRDGPAVSSSAALFGLLGAMISSLVRNWKLYAGKYAAIVFISTILVVNFLLGLLPYVDNFSSLGGLVAGTLLGFVLLYAPEIRKFNHYKGGLFEFDTKTSIMKLKQKLDKPVVRIVSLLLFVILASGSVALVIRGADLNIYCSWCQYADCVPSTRWSCRAKAASCEAIETGAGWTLTCERNGNYKVLPNSDLSRARMEDLCSLICT